MHRPETYLRMTSEAPGARVGAEACTQPSAQRFSMDEAMERCPLDTRRHVSRLEEIAHRLATLWFRTRRAPDGAIVLLTEGNRRLRVEVDEFHRDLHALQHLADSRVHTVAIERPRSRA